MITSDTTIGDLERSTEWILTFQHGQAKRLAAPLRDFNALVWTAHHRPPRSQDLPLKQLGPTWRALADFYRTTSGEIVRALGDILGDIGATEISETIVSGLQREGFTPLWVMPSLGGRVGVDWNRKPCGTNVPIPREVAATHITMHTFGITTLFEIGEAMAPQLQVLLQPHTMASGECKVAPATELTERQKAINPDALPLESYETQMVALRDAWHTLYNETCISGEPRPDCDIVTGYEGAEPLPDGGLADLLAQELTNLGIKGAKNAPFHHVQGYPGSDLIERIAAARNAKGLSPVPQTCFDLAKRHVQNPDSTFDALNFPMDKRKVQDVSDAVVEAVLKILA